jgi:hypothetical protein
MIETLREVLAQACGGESRAAGQEGIYFAIEGKNEVSLHYDGAEHEGLSLGAARSRKAKSDVLAACRILAERGYALTLVLSPRTLALYVRSETEI